VSTMAEAPRVADAQTGLSSQSSAGVGDEVH
jgi:hypothetical protein